MEFLVLKISWNIIICIHDYVLIFFLYIFMIVIGYYYWNDINTQIILRLVLYSFQLKLYMVN